MRSVEMFKENIKDQKSFLRLELKFTFFFHDC